MADQCINPNPDIAGIGVRINFYVTILLTALLPKSRHTTELLDGLYLNAMLYGLSLVITVVIQSAQNQLDLYHAVYVMHCLLPLEFVYICGQIRFKMSQAKLRMNILIATQMISSMAFLIWLLFVWSNPGDFGSQKDCNPNVIFVLFFYNVNATEDWLASAITSLVLTYLVTVVFIFCLIFLAYFRKFIRKRLRIAVDAGTGLGEAIKGAIRGGTSRSESVLEWVLFATSAIPAIYCVVTLELIVHRNHPNIKPGENDFGFGQIVAVVLLFGSLVDVVVTIYEWYKRRRNAPTSKQSYEQLPDDRKSDELPDEQPPDDVEMPTLESTA